MERPHASLPSYATGDVILTPTIQELAQRFIEVGRGPPIAVAGGANGPLPD